MAVNITIDNVMSTFPYPSLSPINGVPTFETINDMVTNLKANAAAIHTDNGGGQFGFLALMVSPTVYATLTNEPFIVPANPGPTPVPLANHPTGAQIIEHNRAHAESLYASSGFTTRSVKLSNAKSSNA